MDVTVATAREPVSGARRVPASKSLHQRALLLAALSERETRLEVPASTPAGDDVRRLRAALEALGPRWVDGALGTGRERVAVDLGLGATGFRYAMAAASLRPAGARHPRARPPAASGASPRGAAARAERARGTREAQAQRRDARAGRRGARAAARGGERHLEPVRVGPPPDRAAHRRDRAHVPGPAGLPAVPGAHGERARGLRRPGGGRGPGPPRRSDRRGRGGADARALPRGGRRVLRGALVGGGRPDGR